MGLFDKLKSIISKKEKQVEEIKEEYNVSDVSEISDEMINDIDVDDEQIEDIEIEEIDEEDEVDEFETQDDEDDIETEKILEEDEDDIEENPLDDEDENELSDDLCDEEDDDEEWAEFVKVHQKVKEAQDIETYDKGLEKTRKEFVSKLSMLGIKYTKVSEEYFEELEEILINADVGVNTVMNFMDQLRARVKKEKITDTEYLNEVIVDELFIIYVDNESLSDKINMSDDGPTVILMVGVNGV